MRTSLGLVTSVSMLFVSTLVACGSSAKTESKYPPRPPGCEIRLFVEGQLPSYATENIGTVQASCDETITDEDCLRELQDQACNLGADTVWGVNEEPTREYGKKKFSGRAAHQK